MSLNELQVAETLAAALEECQIEEKEPPGIVMSNTCDPSLLKKFPKPKNRVPPVFLHKPVKFGPLMRKVLSCGIKFYIPVATNHYTKICCQTFEDHKALKQFFNNKHLPHHTYGHPGKRKMKVVFRGLPKDLDLVNFKKQLESVSIPIVRVHKMRNKEHAKDMPLAVLVVVPNTDEGRKILQVETYCGHSVEIERPKPRSRQCYRCQKWGHSQRYCNGHVKCVKCGGDHLSKKCFRDPVQHPPKCANCSSDHTSNYKLCPFSPDSPQYEKKMLTAAIMANSFPDVSVRQLITLKNYHLFLTERI